MMFSGRLGCSLHGFLPISEPPFAINLEFLVKITQSWFFCFCALASTAAWADDAAQPALLTASAPATPSVIEDEIQQTWQQRDFQLSDDIVVVNPPPTAPQTPVKLNTATTAVVKTQTRMKPPRVQPAKIVSLPPAKPVLTRTADCAGNRPRAAGAHPFARTAGTGAAAGQGQCRPADYRADSRPRRQHRRLAAGNAPLTEAACTLPV